MPLFVLIKSVSLDVVRTRAGWRRPIRVTCSRSAVAGRRPGVRWPAESGVARFASAAMIRALPWMLPTPRRRASTANTGGIVAACTPGSSSATRPTIWSATISRWRFPTSCAEHPQYIEGAARLGADRPVDRLRGLEVPDGLGVRPQQSQVLPAARAAAVVRDHVRRSGTVKAIYSSLGAGDRAADGERLGAGHGLAAVRQDDGALVQHQRARPGGVDLERVAQRRRRAGRDAGAARRHAVRRLGREVLFQRRDRRGGGGRSCSS